MRIAVLISVLMLSGCTEAFRAPSVFHNKGDVITGYSLAFFDASCRSEKVGDIKGCGKRYSPVSRKIDDLSELMNQYSSGSFDYFKRNETQKLLMSFSDDLCAQYQYQVLGVQLGAKVGANLLVAAADTLESLVSLGFASEFSKSLIGLFSNSGQILDDELLRTIYFTEKMRYVQTARREMKKVILAGQKRYYLENETVERGAIEPDKSVPEYYSMTEAIADVVAYHRVCDLGQLLVSGDTLSDAYMDLYAYKFKDDWGNTAPGG